MSLNFLGLGASIGIKDLGASKMAAALTTAFGGVGSALTAITSTATGAAAALGGIAALGAGKLLSVGKHIADIGTAGRELTTEFEATAQAHSVATRRMIAQTGIFGKELNKLNGQAAGMAHGMGMSDQTAAHAVATFSQFKDEMKALGVESAVSAGKVEEGLGVSIRDIGFQMHRLKDGLKLSQKDMEELGKSFTSTGIAIKDVGAPFKTMDAAMDLAARRTLLVKQGLSSIGGKESIKSINNATRALFILTGDAKGSQEAALGLEEKLLASMENFRNMFTGNSNDLDAFLYNTSVVTGDVQKAFEAAADGPEAFIKQFGTVVSKLKKDGKSTEEVLKFFGGQMSEALGPELANRLLLAVSNADDAKMQMIKTNKDISKSLGEMGKDAWRSTKTLADQYNMVVGAGMAAFRDIGRGAARAFVSDTKKAFDAFNAQAKDLVKKGGPLGAIVEKMSEMSSLGAVAILPKSMRASAAVFGELYNQLSPSLSAITNVTGALSGMLNPLTLLSAGLAGFVGLVIKNKNETNTWSDAIVAAVDDVKEFADTWTQKILKWAYDFDWVKVFNILAQGIATGLDALTRIFDKIGGQIDDSIQDAVAPADGRRTFGQVGAKMFSALKESFSKFNWGEILSNLIKSMKGAKDRVVKELKDFLKETFDSTPESTWKEIGESVGKGFRFVIGALVDAVKGNAETQSQIWSLMYELGKGIVKALPAIQEGFEAGLGNMSWILYVINPVKAMMAVTGWIAELGQTIVSKIVAIWDEVKAATVQVWNDLFGHSIVPDMVEKGFEEIKGVVLGFLTFVEHDVVGRITGAFSGVVDKVKGLFGGGKSANSIVEGDMTESVKTIEAATDKMKDYVQKQLFVSVTEGITKAFSEAFKKIQEGSKDFFAEEVKAFQKFAEWSVKLFKNMWSSILDDMDIVGQAMSSIMGQVEKDVANMKNALDQLKAAQDQVNPAKRDDKGNLVRKETEKDALLREVIDNPQWTVDYMDTFKRSMSDLIGAVNGLRGSGVASAKTVTAAEAKQNIKNRVPDWFAVTNASRDDFNR